MTSFASSEFAQYLNVILLWIHIISIATWFGGTVFFAFVLRPLYSVNNDLKQHSKVIATRYRQVFNFIFPVLAISGLALFIMRATNSASVLWFVLIGIKLFLVAVMLYIVFKKPTSNKPPEKSLNAKISNLIGYNAFLFYAVIVLYLSTFLNELA